MSFSTICFLTAYFYDDKQQKIELPVEENTQGLYYIHLLNHPVIHLNIYYPNGKKYLEIKDKGFFLSRYFISKKAFFNKSRTIKLNEKVHFHIHGNKNELNYQLDGKNYTIVGFDNYFYIEDQVYEWINHPLLFNFEIKKDNKVVLIGQKGKMRVSDVETFQNPNMPSIQLMNHLEENEKIILFAILVLKWSGKYS